MTTKEYIELLANELELRKAQYARLGDLNAAIRLMKRYHVPEDNPEYLKLRDKQCRLQVLMDYCDKLMRETEYYDRSEEMSEWLEWWEEQKDIEL